MSKWKNTYCVQHAYVTSQFIVQNVLSMLQSHVPYCVTKIFLHETLTIVSRCNGMKKKKKERKLFGNQDIRIEYTTLDNFVME